MRDKLRKKNFNEKGITLIALIITIIIMLILVAVTIDIAVDGKLFEKAQEAVDKTNDKVGQTQDRTDELMGELDKVLERDPKNVAKTASKYKSVGLYAIEETILEDDEKNKIVLPEGFKIASASATVVNDGVVVEDEEGNQYVWVPVTKDAEGENTTPYAETGTLADGTEIKLSRYAFNNEGVETDMQDEEIRLHHYGITGFTSPWVAAGDEGSDDVVGANNIEEFKASVAENGGYYIARYEASYRMEDGKAMSKVSVAYEGDAQEGRLFNGVTQPEASEVCQDLYLNVKSDLINSYAWDTALVYIQKCSDNTTYSLETSKNDSLSNTGTNGDEVCKINDLASNLGEWTTEKRTFPYANLKLGTGTYDPTARGGRFDTDADARYRGGSSPIYEYTPTATYENVGFRAILYI